LKGWTAINFAKTAVSSFSHCIEYFDDNTDAWDLSAAVIIAKKRRGFVTDLEGYDIAAISNQGYIIVSTNDDF